ncbi:MAG: efflux RND transporter permease subunit [Candidatus Polarisedimenticolaceae bacterium]|nr:efflux RND transporter permease subunit [Candidatus Polarisedimenticolaceae bacterium]
MIAWFARNSVAANILMATILLLGTWSALERIPLEVFPAFERDVINIAVSYRGATPAEVEEAAVIRIEEAIADLAGIETITSSAMESAGMVQIEVEKGSDPRVLLEDIKNKVDAINSFPNEVERPIYSLQEFHREVISVAVSADLPDRELRRLGEQVRDDLMALPEVNIVDLMGVRAYEISVEIKEQTLRRYGLTFSHIAEAIRRSSIDLPAGAIKSEGGEIMLRTKGQAYSAEEFANINIISAGDGSRLTLGDIAHIHDGFEEDPLYAIFNGRPAVFIEVYRTGQQSAIEVARAVREYVEASKGQMQEGIALGYWRDRSRIVKLRLETLFNNAWQGGLLVFLCLALFLRLQVAIWVCVGIPVSFMGALILMPALGVTLNVMSLFAFILVLGIVVDDAIITGENIYSHLKRGESGVSAAIKGAQEVAVPVTFGLLTTLVAFLPIMYLSGYRGPIFAQITLVIIPVLIFSWVESKLILPSHIARVRISDDTPGRFQRFQQATADGLERFILAIYRPLLEWMLNRRYLTLALFIGVSLIVMSYVASGRYGFTFFPRVQSETARATLLMQTGTPEAEMARQINRMTLIAEDLKEKYTDPVTGESVIRNVLTSIGWRAGRKPRSGTPELGQVSLELMPPEERTLPITTTELVSEWRQAIGPIAGSKELNYRAEIGRGGDPINIQLMGQDFEVLGKITSAIKMRLKQYDGVFDIQDTFEQGQPEITLVIRPEAELLGLSAADLGRQVRQAFFGAEAQRIQRGRDDVRVMVRYPREERHSLATLDSMRIRTPDGQEVPIGNVTEIQMGSGFAKIRRVDRQRAVNVTADADKERTNLPQVMQELRLFLDELLQQYPGVRYSFEGELREQRESFSSLAYGVLFIFFSIYVLLAVPLRSYLQPLVILMVIPFSLVGAIFGHALLGMNISLLSIMGMLALAGVVVNDSLVLVDWINRRRREGMAVAKAVRAAGVARFRPILLTSLTTFFGLAPLLLEKSTQAQFLVPMAVSLGFGILYATMLSLILVPAGYLVLEDMKGWLGASDSTKQLSG